MDWKKYEASVRDEIGVPAGDTDRVQRAITSAISYVAGAIDGYSVPDPVKTDCVTACAADLYNSRDARLGVSRCRACRHRRGRCDVREKRRRPTAVGRQRRNRVRRQL